MGMRLYLGSSEFDLVPWYSFGWRVFAVPKVPMNFKNVLFMERMTGTEIVQQLGPETRNWIALEHREIVFAWNQGVQVYAKPTLTGLISCTTMRLASDWVFGFGSCIETLAPSSWKTMSRLCVLPYARIVILYNTIRKSSDNLTDRNRRKWQMSYLTRLWHLEKLSSPVTSKWAKLSDFSKNHHRQSQGQHRRDVERQTYTSSRGNIPLHRAEWVFLFVLVCKQSVPCETTLWHNWLRIR